MFYIYIMNHKNDAINYLSHNLEKQDEQDTGICESCSNELEAIYENNGFTPPAGPAHYEIVGYKPCEECYYNERCDWENDEAFNNL